MANRVAKFEKVSFEQFKKDWKDTFDWNDMMRLGLMPRQFDEPGLEGKIIQDIYNSIKTPSRSTSFSAGYDFKSPIAFKLNPEETIKIPTGIRCRMNNDYVLQIYPRSSLGFKHMFVPMNLVAIVDSDYYDSDNEGHIFMKMKNCGDKIVEIKAGDSFCQGIFINYGITEDDSVYKKRNGGFGSTDKKEE